MSEQTLDFVTQREHALLSDAAYNRNTNGDSGEPEAINFNDEVKAKYDIREVHAVDGDFVYTFTSKQTGEVIVAGRGTDSIPFFDPGPTETSPLGDQGQWISIANGEPTSLGVAMAKAAQDVFEMRRSVQRVRAKQIILGIPRRVKFQTVVQDAFSCP